MLSKKRELVASLLVISALHVLIVSALVQGASQDRAIGYLSTLTFIGTTDAKTGVFGHWQSPEILNLIQPHGTQIEIYDINGTLLETYNTEHQININLVADVDGDGLDEAFVEWSNGSTVRIDVIDQNWSTIKTFSKSAAPDSNIRAWYFTDLDGDGDKEIICSVSSGSSQNLRGVLVFDYNRGNEEWFGNIGPLVTNIQITDVNGDNALELVASSYAPCNGKVGSYNDDDAHSYVYVWDANGSFKWKYNTGDYFTGCDIGLADMNNDGIQDVITTVFTAEDFREDFGKLLILNGSEYLLKSISFEHGRYGIVTGDFDKSLPGKEIVIGSNNLVLQMYDANLNLLQEYAFSSSTDYWHFIVPQFVHENEKGELEILVTQYERHEIHHDISGSVNQLTDVKLLVLSKDLIPKCTLDVTATTGNANTPCAMAKLGVTKNVLRVAVYADKTYIYGTKVSIDEQGSQSEDNSILYYAVAGCISCVIVLIVIYFMVKRKKQVPPPPPPPPPPDLIVRLKEMGLSDVVDLITENGQVSGEKISSNWDKIENILNKEMLNSNEQWRNEILSIRDELKERGVEKS